MNSTAYANAPASVQQQVAADEASGSAANAYNVAASQQTGNGAGEGLGSQDNFFYALGGATGNGGGSGDAASLGSLVTDVIVIGTVGACIWAFFEFNGVGFLKTLTARNKWWVLGIVGAVALGIYLAWQELQKTASDATNTATGFVTGTFAALNPFSGGSS